MELGRAGAGVAPTRPASTAASASRCSTGSRPPPSEGSTGHALSATMHAMAARRPDHQFPLPFPLVAAGVVIGVLAAVAAVKLKAGSDFGVNLLASLAFVGLTVLVVNVVIPWYRSRRRWAELEPRLDEALVALLVLCSTAGEWYQRLMIAAAHATSQESDLMPRALTEWRHAVRASAQQQVWLGWTDISLPSLPVAGDVHFTGPVHYARGQRERADDFEPDDLVDPSRWTRYAVWHVTSGEDRLSAPYHLVELADDAGLDAAWEGLRSAVRDWDAFCVLLDEWLRQPDRSPESVLSVLHTILDAAGGDLDARGLRMLSGVNALLFERRATRFAAAAERLLMAVQTFGGAAADSCTRTDDGYSGASSRRAFFGDDVALLDTGRVHGEISRAYDEVGHLVMREALERDAHERP
jgi:uncharacterized membrane protein (UPF0136 family)